MTTLTLAKALNAGLRRALADDDKVVLMGEDIGTLGGVFRVTDGLQAEFGADRVVDTPLAEAGIVGTAVGLAYRGYRPVVEIQFDGFIYPALRPDRRAGRQAALPHRAATCGCRSPSACRSAAASARPSTTPSRPRRTSRTPRGCASSRARTRRTRYTMIRQAIASDDPVLFFEPKRRYHVKGEVDETASLADATADGRRARSWHRAPTSRSSPTARSCRPRATPRSPPPTTASRSRSSTCARSRRSTTPPSRRPCAAPAGSSSRTRPASRAASAPSSPRAITERCFDYLEAAPVRVTGYDIPYPPAKLETHHLPDLDRILDGVDRVLGRPNSLSGVEA